jgi:hypothetical protein
MGSEDSTHFHTKRGAYSPGQPRVATAWPSGDVWYVRRSVSEVTPRRSWLAVLAGLSVGSALTLRWWHRGHYQTGWEVLATAQGLFMVSTRSAADLFRFYSDYQHIPSQWIVYSIPVSLLPGWLTSLAPWGYWAHVTTMAMVALSLWLLGLALRLSGGQWWLLLLCWGASPALLSFTATGFAYISSIVPYAVAIWVVFRWQTSVVGTLLLALLAVGLAWQVQELGRTVFLVFAAAAVLLPAVPWRIRVVWLAVAGLQYWLATTYLNGDTSLFLAMRLPPPGELPGHLAAFARYLFVERGVDLPILLTGALLATLAARSGRWFWGALVGVHLGLLFLVAMNNGTLQGPMAVWPRRALLFQFVCVGTIVSALRAGGALRPWLLALLVAGNAWQLADTVRWASRDLDAEHRGFFTPLPFTQSPFSTGHDSPNLDSEVRAFAVDWSRSLRQQVEQGRKLLVVYNLSSHDENVTDPAAVLDRLYIELGHDRFMENVWVFGNENVRWNFLPIRPLDQFPTFVASLHSDGFAGEWLYHPHDDEPTWNVAKVHRAELQEIFDTLKAHFDLEWSGPDRDPEGRESWRFTLRPKRAGDD